jgi:hypothetical protein
MITWDGFKVIDLRPLPLADLEEKPAIKFLCEYCGNTAGWLVIAGDKNAQTDLIRMLRDYHTYNVCPKCMEANQRVRMTPEVDNRIDRAELFRQGPMEP